MCLQGKPCDTAELGISLAHKMSLEGLQNTFPDSVVGGGPSVTLIPGCLRTVQSILKQPLCLTVPFPSASTST